MPFASHTTAGENHERAATAHHTAASTVRAITLLRSKSQPTQNAAVVQPKYQRKPLTKKVPCRPRSNKMGSADFGAGFVLKGFPKLFWTLPNLGRR